ncbi:MAG: hypothetical protein OHK0046_24630 [Anaerolineae bacterium]
MRKFWIAFLILLLIPASTYAADLPADFTESLVAEGLIYPTTMAFAPDGRLFITEQEGAVRVVKNGVLLPDPFLTVAVDARGERGLLGIAFDPNFASNQYVYIYYTTAEDPIHNRVSRFTANGDVAVPGSEVPLLDIAPLSSAQNHNGGALHFGADGKLYVAVGDNANAENAERLDTLKGKILRLNPDGSIPTDNPLMAQTTGDYQAIWAYGLRNPYNFAVQPGTGQIFVNDVGQNTWEEINEGIPGANYGWPATEGETDNPDFVSPLYVYGHGGGPDTGCSIVGAAFYNPATVTFPADYVGDYFFADYCSRWIKRYDAATDTAIPFATNTAPQVIDIRVAANGDLYYLARNGSRDAGVVYRVSYNAPPEPTQPITLLAPTGTVTDSLGNPDFIWNAADGVEKYEFYLARTSSITVPVFYGTFAAADYCTANQCSVNLTTIDDGGFYWLPNDTYSVYLRAAGDNWPSTGQQFTLATAAPAAPTLNAPTFSFEGASRPTYNWTLEGDAALSTWFQLYVALRSNLAAPAVNLWVNRVDACGSLTSTTCALTPAMDLANGEYEAYLRSWNPGGFSDYAAPQPFTLAWTPPPLIQNMDVSLTPPLTFSWDAAENASWYQIWIGSADFSQTYHIRWLTAAELGCDDGGTCAFLPEGIVIGRGSNAWFVQAWGSGGLSSGGDFGGWSQGPSFTI